MNSFKRGFGYKHPVVLVVALSLVAVTLAGCQGLFASGAWTVVPLDLSLRTTRDSFTYVSWTVGRLKQEPPSGPAVYLLGGSSAREAIVSGEALAVEMTRLGGPAAEAYDLGSHQQTFAESLAVIDNVPNTPAWVLIGVNLGRFTADKETNARQAEGREFLLATEELEAFLEEKWGIDPSPTGILPGAFAYVSDLGARQLGRLESNQSLRREYQQHVYRVDEVHSDKRKDRLVDVWFERRYPLFEQNRAANLELLEVLVRRGKERGLNVILVELPLNEAIVRGRFDATKLQYQRPVRSLAKRYGVTYMDFNDDLDLHSSDFYDLSHLVEPGRVIWQQRLARELVSLMNETSSAR